MAWALTRALRFAIGTCVVALILATTLSGETAERFATTAYLAAIVAAVALAAGRFLPVASQESAAVPVPVFPKFLAYSTGLAFFLSLAAALVSQPGAEALAIIACFALVFLAVLVRCGTMAAFNTRLVRGGFIEAAIRYAVLFGISALAIAGLVPSDAVDSLTKFAYRLMILATLLLCVSLIAPTRAGLWVQRSSVRTVAWLDQLADAFVFERTVSYAAIVAVAAIALASLLPAPFAEPFAIAAYTAAVCAAVGVAMECRRLRS
jgi:hypothetical protein